MNKRKFLAGILVLSTVLMGTGYAYWTDALNITTKATTGELNVKFLDLALYGQYGGEDNEYGWSIIDGIDTGWVGSEDGKFYFGRGEDHNKIGSDTSLETYADRTKGFNNVKFTADYNDRTNTLENATNAVNPAYDNTTIIDDQIKVTLDKIYPGYAQAFQADIANVGNIAAKLSKVEVKAIETGTKEASNEQKEIGVALYVQREYAGPNGAIDGKEGHVNVLASDGAATDSDDYFTVGGVKFIRLSALEELNKVEITEPLLYATPDDNRMDVYFAVAMDPDAEGKYTSGTATARTDVADELSENKSVEITMDFLWDQFNVNNPTDAPTNLLGKQDLTAKPAPAPAPAN